MKAFLFIFLLSLTTLQSFGIVISNGIPQGTTGYYAIDDATRIGTFQSVISNDERNVSWAGWSADEFPQLKNTIGGGTVLVRCGQKKPGRVKY